MVLVPHCSYQIRNEDLIAGMLSMIADDRLLTTMTEPLNLISRPLDLTKCRGMDDEADDDPDSVYGMLMSVTADKLSCVCGKTFDVSAMDTFSTHVASCAKSKLTPYRS